MSDRIIASGTLAQCSGCKQLINVKQLEWHQREFCEPLSSRKSMDTCAKNDQGSRPDPQQK